MVNIRDKSRKILFVIIILWGGLALARTFYNFSKVYTEEISWILISDSEKRVRLFADLYRVVTFVDFRTPANTQILLLAPGGKTFYLSRYYLYPRRLTYVKSIEEMHEALKTDTFDYLVMFQTSETGLNEYDSLSWKIQKNPTYYSSEFDNKQARISIYKL